MTLNTYTLLLVVVSWISVQKGMIYIVDYEKLWILGVSVEFYITLNNPFSLGNNVQSVFSGFWSPDCNLEGMWGTATAYRHQRRRQRKCFFSRKISLDRRRGMYLSVWPFLSSLFYCNVLHVACLQILFILMPLISMELLIYKESVSLLYNEVFVIAL